MWKLAGRWFSGRPVVETVETAEDWDSGVEAVWRSMVTYEEVEVPPPLLLTLLLPAPVRTEGDKRIRGAHVECIYRSGSLVKRMTAVEPPARMEFDVLDQELGIEDCARAISGGYRITASGSGSRVALTTRYLASLHPRWLWRPVEHYLAHRLHRHVLGGMRSAMARPEAKEAACKTWC